MTEFNYLFSPIQVGSVTAKNRICCSAHADALSEEGMPGDAQRLYYEEKARGGTGFMMCMGVSSVRSQRKRDPRRNGWRCFFTSHPAACHSGGAQVRAQYLKVSDGIHMNEPANRKLAEQVAGRIRDYVREQRDFPLAHDDDFVRVVLASTRDTAPSDTQGDVQFIEVSDGPEFRTDLQ